MFSFIILTIIFFPLIIGLLFIYFHRKKGYWQRRGIPGPKPIPIKGNLDSIFGLNPERLQLRKWSQEYGKVFGYQHGWYNVMVISEPEMARQLLNEKFEYFHGRMWIPSWGDPDKTKDIDLLVTRGKRWKRLRSIANPAFSVSNLKKVMPLIDDSVQMTMNLLDDASKNGNSINLHRFFLEMSLDVISRMALGQKESRQFQNEYFPLLNAAFRQMNNNPFDYLSWIFPWLGRNIIHKIILWTGNLRNDPLVKMKINLKNVVEERKRKLNKKEENEEEEEEDMNGRKRRVDFIDLFLEAESANFEFTQNGGTYNKKEKFELKNTPDEIVMNSLMFLLAGYDTTSNTLSIMCHYLVLHPEIQTKLRDEIDSICVDDEPSYEQLSKLKYMEAVFNETLRLCPIAPVIRFCAETTKLGDYIVEKGTGISVDTFTLHRDKKIWGEDADEFRPERWLGDGRTQMANNFYGFGGGPRICIGMRLAIMEEKIAMVYLLRRFILKKCAETENELTLRGQIVLNPESVTVKLEHRI